MTMYRGRAQANQGSLESYSLNRSNVRPLACSCLWRVEFRRRLFTCRRNIQVGSSKWTSGDAYSLADATFKLGPASGIPAYSLADATFKLDPASGIPETPIHLPTRHSSWIQQMMR